MEHVTLDVKISPNGAFSWVIVIPTILNIPLLWFLCRRDMLEVNFSFSWRQWKEKRKKIKTKGPWRGLHVKFQNFWSSTKEMEKRGWSSLTRGHTRLVLNPDLQTPEIRRHN
jgi:hypothetical protein